MVVWVGRNASPREVPGELLEQLASDGSMVVPVGDDGNQTLQLITCEDGEFRHEVIERVKFVPMLGGVQ